jgi:porin
MGVRSKLADRGVTVAVLFIADSFGNVSGGIRYGAADYNLAAFGIIFHTDRLFGWLGGQFHVGVAENFGKSLSRECVGNKFPIQLADVADAHSRLTYLSYTQSLWEDRLSIRLGRLTINSVSRVLQGIRIPRRRSGAARNIFERTRCVWLSGHDLGARVKFQPVKQFYAMAGAYNGDPRLKQGSRHGLDFSLRGPVFAIGEIGVCWSCEENFPRLPGNLKIGGYRNGGSARVFAAESAVQSETARGRNGFYVVADQALVRWGDSAPDRHLGVFGAFMAAPDQRINPVPYFFDTGLVAYGPSSKRPRDFVGLALVYGSYSRDLRLAEELNPAPLGAQNF